MYVCVCIDVWKRLIVRLERGVSYSLKTQYDAVWAFRLLIVYWQLAKAPLFEFRNELLTCLVVYMLRFFSEQFTIPLFFVLTNLQVCVQWRVGSMCSPTSPPSMNCSF